MKEYKSATMKDIARESARRLADELEARERDPITPDECRWMRRLRRVMNAMPPGLYVLALRDGGYSVHRQRAGNAQEALDSAYHPRVGQLAD